MLQFRGAPALSSFRIESLLATLRRIEPAVRAVAVDYLHFVDVARAARRRASRACSSGCSTSMPAPRRSRPGSRFSTVPRPGTISPWSSKATDIAHVCGLDAVRRIERGRAWRIDAGGTLSRARLDGARGAAVRPDDRSADVRRGRGAAPVRDASRAAPLGHVALGDDPQAALARANAELGLALSDGEIAYLADVFRRLGRDPTDVEVMMFAQANSEHCRHKIFNADWRIDGEREPRSLFAMIRNTHDQQPRRRAVRLQRQCGGDRGPARRALLRRRPTAASTAGARSRSTSCSRSRRTTTRRRSRRSRARRPAPAARSATKARPGAAPSPRRGSSASRSRTCASRISCSPGRPTIGRPARIASALDIMLEGPIGAAAFNNEFGRPGILGYFRTFEQRVAGDRDGRRARLSQADHDRRRPRQRAARARREAAGARRRAAGAARRAGDADRPRRRRGLVAGQRRRQRGARLRLGAARQSGDAAPRAAGHRRLLGAGRGATRS